MIDFAPWDELLRRYVNEDGRVNYRRWQAESMNELNQWLAGLATLDLTAETDPDLQLALWLNVYNAIVIAQVLKSYPINSIRPKLWGIPNWIAFLWFFSRPTYEIAGKRYSLNQIEHGILRQKFEEPRIHFALVCAAIGCPLLRNEAYWPATVGTQLEQEAGRFIHNPDKVRWDEHTNTLYCSQIFKWYRQDFLKVTSSLPEYINRYLKRDDLAQLEPTLVYLPYNWALNDTFPSI